MPVGRKPNPEGQRVNRHPLKHDWEHAEGVGWQFGDPSDRRRKFPKPPDGLMPESIAAWEAWFKSWWAANWREEDLPQLVLVVRKFDEVHRGHLDVAKLIPLLDRYGITPKGRQDLRWAPPKTDKPAEKAPATGGSAAPARLRVVDTA